jgi:hypothetical protein
MAAGGGYGELKSTAEVVLKGDEDKGCSRR